MPRIIACGGRKEAYDDFCTGVHNDSPATKAMLLVDSESPVEEASPWAHLKKRTGDQWSRPSAASDDQCHLMVQCMESWFLTDRVALTEFFGQGLSGNALPNNPNIEEIDKKKVLNSLRNATRNCLPKGAYDKGNHSFKLLARIDPEKTVKASPWAKRFVEVLAIIANK